MNVLSKITAVLLLLTAHSAYSATVVQNSSNVWWGSTGDYADLVIYYDWRATAPINVTQFLINPMGNTTISEALQDCFKCTPIKSGDSVIGERLQPGGFMVMRATRASAVSGVVGTATVSDATSNTTNINTYVRTGLEIRDSSSNVLTHVEVR